MHNRDYIDLGRLLDQIFQATEEFTKSFGPFSFDQKSKAEHRNYYSIYPFPPANIYMLQDKTMVFEFALAGYRDTDISLEFLGDNMVLSARAPETATDTDEVMFFNRRLKYTDIPEQKYFVPEDKFDREAAKAVYKSGILKVTVPPRDEVQDSQGVKITIINEDE
ncbi:MAG: Hsp20 family protein [Alkalispirochaeta sp.]|jgi:molecular chaperone IbpB/HSP20 family protein